MRMTGEPAMAGREWLFLIAGAVLWGSAYFCNALALAELPPLTILALRLAFAVSVLIPAALLAGLRLPVRPGDIAPFFVMTLFSNVGPYLLVLEGQKGTTSGLAAVLTATAPLFTILLAHLWTTDERLRLNKLIGVLVGIAGVAFVMGGEAWRSWDSELVAKCLVIAAAVLYAVGGIYAKRLTHYPPLVLASSQMTCGLIVSLPLALAFDTSAFVTGVVLYIGVFGSALAAIAYFNVFKRAGATNAMLTTLLVPLTPILLGGVFLGELLSTREIAGTLAIAVALVIIDGRVARRLQVAYGRF